MNVKIKIRRNDREEVLFDCKTDISYKFCLHKSFLAEHNRNGSFYHRLLFPVAICISKARDYRRIYDGADDDVCDFIESSFFPVFRWN